MSDEQWQVITGDCLEVMRGMDAGSVDAVITDPPYGLNYVSDTGDRLVNDKMRWFRRLLLRMPDAFALTSARTLGLFCHWSILGEVQARFEKMWPPCGVIVWDKNNMGRGNTNHFGTSYELIYVSAPAQHVMRINGRRPMNVLRHSIIPPVHAMHTTEKPVPLMRDLIEMLCPAGGLVIDPFCGSGTTGVACVQTGRRFIGIEIDPGYADIARARITKAAEQARQLTLGIEQAA